jgi:hypothetical protein
MFSKCARNEKMGVAWPKAQIWKIREIRRGFLRGRCTLHLREEQAKHIQKKCSETKKEGKNSHAVNGRV